MKKAARTNKIFVDWSQNDEHKTTVSVYSLRAREHPTVSTPITWEEVERTLKKKDASLLVFESQQTLERVAKMGDLFAPLLSLKQKLPKLAGIGEGEPQVVSEIAAQASRKKPVPGKQRKSSESETQPLKGQSRKRSVRHG